MNLPTCMEVELDRAVKLVRKDHKQRWVFQDHAGAHITDQPIPFRDGISVTWCPIARAVTYRWKHRLLAHDAIAGTHW